MGVHRAARSRCHSGPLRGQVRRRAVEARRRQPDYKRELLNRRTRSDVAIATPHVHQRRQSRTRSSTPCPTSGCPRWMNDATASAVLLAGIEGAARPMSVSGGGAPAPTCVLLARAID